MVENILKYCKSNILSKDVDIFNTHSRIIISGTSFSGKSQLCYDIVLKYYEKFDHIILAKTQTESLLEQEITLQKKLQIF